MKLIYIEWEDAVSNDEWAYEDVARIWAKTTSLTVKQVGWVLEENKRYLVLVSRRHDWQGGHDSQFGMLQKIPKTWIRKRKVLKI